MRPAEVPRRVLFFATLIAAGSLADPAFAQDISINLGQGNGGVTERAIQMIALLTVLSIAPSILIMMTSFTRIVVEAAARLSYLTAAGATEIRVRLSGLNVPGVQLEEIDDGLVKEARLEAKKRRAEIKKRRASEDFD